MLTKLEINGIKIESDEGVERVFSMLKNIKDFKLENIGKENNDSNSNDEELKKEINSKNKHITSLEKSIASLNSTVNDLKDENSKLKKDNEELKNEKEKYLNEIKKLRKEIEGLNKDIVELKNYKPTIIEEPKAINVTPPTTEVESKQTTSVDFNPNNAEDIAWLQNELTSDTPTPISVPKVEIPKVNTSAEDVVNGIKIVKDNQTGEIIQIEEYVLTSHEKTLLKIGLTTPEKILSARNTMKESDATIAHGWGD